MYKTMENDMKTLYITDLDGTLLRCDQTLSDYTAKALNQIIEKGVCFSYATARSASTAAKVMEKVKAPSVAVVYNGAFIVDMKSGRRLVSNAFAGEESKAILDTALGMSIFPRVYAIVGGKERFAYTKEHLESEGAKEYFRTREGDKRAFLGDVSDLYEGEIFLVSCCNKKEMLMPLYEKLRDFCHCHFYKDNYSSDCYLELVPTDATKENGALKLKEIFGCDRIVAFGDGVNDISLFNAADECYAVENAAPELKEIATAIIGSNENNSVAKWLIENAE